MSPIKTAPTNQMLSTYPKPINRYKKKTARKLHQQRTDEQSSDVLYALRSMQHIAFVNPL